MAEEINQTIHEAIIEYVNEHTPYEVVMLLDHVLMIGKPTDISAIYDGEICVDDKPAPEFITAMLAAMGVKIPTIWLGTEVGSIMLSYKQSILVDYADPKFFSIIDAFLEHIKTHDDLTDFSQSVSLA